MKLLYCRNCCDVFALTREHRACRCGATAGHYVDDLKATFAGAEAVPLGFSSPSFFDALEHQPQAGWGRTFEAFVVPVHCPTFVRKAARDVAPANAPEVHPQTAPAQ